MILICISWKLFHDNVIPKLFISSDKDGEITMAEGMAAVKAAGN